MRSPFFNLLTAALVISFTLGCGLLDEAEKAVSGTDNINAANSNKTLTDRAVDTAVGEQKVGITECDEAIELLAAQTNNPDDNFVTKAVKQTALNRFRDEVRRQLEQNNADKKQVAAFCREFRNNMQQYQGEAPAGAK